MRSVAYSVIVPWQIYRAYGDEHRTVAASHELLAKVLAARHPGPEAAGAARQGR